MASKTLRIVEILNGFAKPLPSEVEELTRIASLNKILLAFLRAANIGGAIRVLEEARYRRYVKSVAEVVEALRDFNYALYKFRKPVEHVSVDIDVLIDYRDLGKAIKELVSKGFKIIAFEKYTVTLAKNNTIVDLYTHPAFAWIIYIDGYKLLDCCVEEFYFEGHVVKGLTREAEAVVSTAHAIYKEHLYLLIDYFVTRKWLSKKALNLSIELGIGNSVEIACQLNELVEKGLLELPHKLPLAIMARTYLNKFIKDSEFRATTPNILKYLFTERIGEKIKWRLSRKTY